MAKNNDWLLQYKKKIILGIVVILTVTVTLTMAVIFWSLRTQLMRESNRYANELVTVIHSSLNHLMMARNPDKIQSTLVAISRENPSLIRMFIMDNRGKIAYSTRESDIGTIIDRHVEPTCVVCHEKSTPIRKGSTMTVLVDGKRVQRYVHIIDNQPVCHKCHSAADRINGKLIMDRSLEPAYALVRNVILIITVLGLVCLGILVPFLWRVLAKGVNTYIAEIRLKSAELTVLYGIVERLSTTIELEQLKHVIIEIISEALAADEIDMVLPNEYRELGAMVWTKEGQAVVRKKVLQGSLLHEAIHRWTEGKLIDQEIAADGSEVRMPISKGGSRLALIVVRSGSRTFDDNQIPMIRAMANHIAVAFDNAMLYHMAVTDELTGLYSSRHFRQMISKRYSLFEEFGEKMTLLMVDIDNFKKINDTYGHPAGDAILRDVGRCILSSIRDDDLAFRYGGEEFAVLLPATDIAAGKAVAERMRALIANYPFRADQHVLSVTVSIGVAAWPVSADTIREIIMEADRGLYEAKHTGKNRVVVRTKETNEK